MFDERLLAQGAPLPADTGVAGMLDGNTPFKQLALNMRHELRIVQRKSGNWRIIVHNFKPQLPDSLFELTPLTTWRHQSHCLSLSR